LLPSSSTCLAKQVCSLSKSTSMRQFDFYEFTGILAPGALTLVGFGLAYTPAWQILVDRTLSFGDLGVFLILAYIAGHLTQAVGNMLEAVWWMIMGGKPSLWSRRGQQTLIAPSQVKPICDAMQQKLQIDPNSLDSASEIQKIGVTRQIYASLAAAQRTARIDIFNGNYGICRGIAASLCITLFVMIVTRGFFYWKLELLLVIGIILAIYRMHRFAQHYARELLVQFLQLSLEPEPVQMNKQ